MEDNNKKNSPILLIILFFVVLAFIFFMPNISKLFDKDPETIVDDGKMQTFDVIKDDQASLYDYSNDLVINYDGVSLSNFDLTNGLTFTLTNNKNSVLLYSENKYYVELFDNNNMLVKRLLLVFDKKLNPEEKYQFTFDKVSFSKISLVKKTINDYPYVELTKNTEDEYQLVCKNDHNEEYTYYFDIDAKLLKIKYTLFKTKSSDQSYLIDAINYKNKAIDLDTKEGIDATFQESLNGFDYINIYDLENVDSKDLNSSYLFAKDTLSKVVNFEVSSQGFTCK